MEQDMKRYVKPPVWQKYLAIALLAFSVIALITGITTNGNDNQAEAEEFYPSDSKVSSYVYVDVIGVSDWVCQYDDDTYYTLLDAEGYFYMARMSKSEFTALRVYNDWWNEEDETVPPPEAKRLYGLARNMGSDARSLTMQAYEMSADTEYTNAFGTMYLDVGSTPSGESSAIWYLAAMFSFLFGLCLLAVCAQPAQNARKCMKRLEQQGWLQAAEQEFAASSSVEQGKDRVRFTQNFVYGRRNGTVVAYADILWCYQKVTRYNFAAVQETLLLQTAWKKDIPLVSKSPGEKSAQESIIDFMLRVINGQNPYALIGFSTENAKAYKAALKAAKNGGASA